MAINHLPNQFLCRDLSEGNPVFPDKEILVVNSYSVFCSGGTG